MKNIVLKIFNYLIFLSISIGLLYAAFRGINFEELWTDIKSANYSWVLFSLFFALLGYVSRALRWYILIEPLGHKPKKTSVFYAMAIGYFANMAIPRIGEITRCETLRRTEKIPFDALLGTVIVERASDLLMLILLMIFVIIFKVELFGKFIFETILDPFFNYISTVFDNLFFFWLILFSLSTVSLFLIYFYRNKLREYELIKKIFEIVKGVMTGAKSVFHMRKRRWFIFHTLFIWLMYILMTYVVFFAIEPTSVLNFVDSIFMLIFGGIGMTIPTPGGIGSYHELVKVGLSLFEINEVDSAVYSIITHESQAFLVIILGSFSILMLFVNRRKKSLK
ncbi:MAG: flippase-like domain-containing protein [Bacteroidetes bacterium]|nr:flippase-like domain-containing protein [Bacteroidota bacterium]MBT6686086.1 flippase-like domain-containing protein [Bacteroidota bacterium]MBT7142021.1 flippase-like domain-containing protein [Bacteroidota bacterium]MBT7493593.1 flippase-like domain-containing protein [Bacteroidota bacterium]